ncbi:MAG: 16S rRNA (adenine(1518)-N(6)/adenine(1519)-N(6))-dimethyltransferase RsmA [Christensenellales bacterium]|jgi:16S rRNA (adenine1518-N6/adenine1519-N6)-dimethyltransferase
MKPSSAKDLSRLLKEFSVSPLKRFGQNFLIDENILNNIADAAHLSGDDSVLEIGPGAGALTLALCKRAGRVVAVEIDKGLIPLLGRTLADCDNAEIIEGDILDPNVLGKAASILGGGFKVVANLPYYITTPVLMALLESGYDISAMVLMVQREVADRLCAAPGTKEYGVLSVAARYYADAETVIRVPASCFYPRPDVDSAVVRLVTRSLPEKPKDTPLFFSVVRAAFAMRRKTLINNLVAKFSNIGRDNLIKLLIASEIDPKRRGETLSIDEFISLSNNILNFSTSVF